MKIKLETKYQLVDLWYFVAFAFGIALYFGLPFEIHLSVWGGLFAVFAIAAFFKKYLWLKICVFFVMGLLIASVRTAFVQTEFLEYPRWNKIIEAKVVSSFSTHSGQMVVLEEPRIYKAKFLPKRIRMKFDEIEPKLSVGDKIKFKGHVYPPQSHQRLRFFYQGIGAQGKIVEVLDHQKGDSGWIDKMRSAIMERLKNVLDEQQAEIAIPLVVGEQGVVSKELYEIYRKAGIAHVLSVSGFHMALLAGFVFFLIRGLFALIPGLVLRISSKKIAAVLAFAVTGFYLLISGVQIPALRSFLMIGIVFLGVITDRKTFSLHTLFLVGFFLLLVRPEWITSISFQLSFCAVMVLVGLVEGMTKHISQIRFLNVIVITLIANILISFVLAPFTIYHFNQLNPYGVVGNLLTSVLFSFLVMPLLFVGTILMPLGCDALFFKWVGFGLGLIIKLASSVANLPGSEIILPSFSPYGLALVGFGLCFVCIIKTRVRYVGLALMLIGIGVGYITQVKPDIIVSDEGKIVLIREQGSFKVRGNLDNWQVKKWLRKNGQKTGDVFKENTFNLKGYKITFDSENCSVANLAILKKADSFCKVDELLIPKKQKVYHIYLGDKIEIKTENQEFSKRPWNKNSKRKEKK